MQDLIERYKGYGERWVKGEVTIDGWQNGSKKLAFSKKQWEYVNDLSPTILASGGRGSGKTTAMVVKMIATAIFFPGNQILLGRKTISEIKKTILLDFFELCSPTLYKYKIADNIIEFFNGSTIVMFGLDALQTGEQKDIKKAQQALKGLNLGSAFIDQLEEVEYPVWEMVGMGLRRNIGLNQMVATTNPAYFWAYDYFKKNPRKGTRLYEIGTKDNLHNLPESFQARFEGMDPEDYKRYFLGVWDINITKGNEVFSKTFTNYQRLNLRNPIREVDSIKIFEEALPEHVYQIGVDPSEGKTDPCGISVVDVTTGRQVAVYSEYSPINVVADKVILLAQMYSSKKKALIIPESNAAGLALIENIKKRWTNIYTRETLERYETDQTETLGFNTNYRTKELLITDFRGKLQHKFAKISDRVTLEQLETFIYTDEAKKKGAGAAINCHDDMVIATMLSFYNLELPSIKRDKMLLLKSKEKKSHRNYEYA